VSLSNTAERHFSLIEYIIALIIIRSGDSFVGITTRQQAGQPTSCVSIPGRGKSLFCFL
jgi:hypothetical protein